MRDKAGGFFDNGDFASETAEDLCEFEADIAAANDDEVTWEGVELEDADIGEVGDFVDAGKVGDDGAAADVDEDWSAERRSSPMLTSLGDSKRACPLKTEHLGIFRR